MANKLFWNLLHTYVRMPTTQPSIMVALLPRPHFFIGVEEKPHEKSSRLPSPSVGKG